MMENNPFAALFPSVEAAAEFRNNVSAERETLLHQAVDGSPEKGESPLAVVEGATAPDVQPVVCSEGALEINSLVESVFLITVDNVPAVQSSSTRPSRCVYLEEVHRMDRQALLGLDNLEMAVFERLMLDQPIDHVVLTRGSVPDKTLAEEAAETRCLHYLSSCYYRYQNIPEQLKDRNLQAANLCRGVIITNTRMVLAHPEIYEGQLIYQQFIDLFKSRDMALENFFEEVMQNVEYAKSHGEEDITVAQVCGPILDLLTEKFQSSSLSDSTLFNLFPPLLLFARKPFLAKVFWDYITPTHISTGSDYETTLLGAILRISCLPQSETGPFEFFDQPGRSSHQDHAIMESNLWMHMSNFHRDVHFLFGRFLRVSDEIRRQMMAWIGNCLHYNSGRAKLWVNMLPLQNKDASDGLMLNLGVAMLRLCRPFLQLDSHKLLKIDPTYCSAYTTDNDEIVQSEIYMKDMHKQTMLVPYPEDLPKPSLASYNFSTACFFVTHQTLHLGFSTIYERFIRLNQELGRVQRLYEEARLQGGEESEAVQLLQTSMERGMSRYLSTKAALLEPNFLELSLKFHITTAAWLNHVAVGGGSDGLLVPAFPLPTPPATLACIPELVVEGMANFIVFLRRFSTKTIEMGGVELQHLMSMVLVFMGSRQRLQNPHLRAKLAEMLESLMPHNDDSKVFNAIGNFSHYREMLFREHPLAKHVVPTLLDVFISIEMTGQSVAFEQKFNYRRPMYIVMEYIWSIDVHREAFKDLAIDAEIHIDATQPPVFLCFINLLVNDAIFLLDEALMYMSRLREQQQSRESGHAEAVVADQRDQNDASFQHTGLLARFHNVMGNSTIHTLELLTREIHTIFTHSAMVDRVAAMLNYFLLHLVGPKSKQLKVRDLSEYEFRPQELVRDICLIYSHLGNSEAFCSAVSRDGRSYSPELFSQAEHVLIKIGQGALVLEMTRIGQVIQVLGERQKAEDEASADAPDEFLDPIMGTLMLDPVLLPTSNVIVDRTTIARHLLSDQTDPFNRSPLTMQVVVSATELKSKIHSWLVGMKQKHKQAAESSMSVAKKSSDEDLALD